MSLGTVNSPLLCSSVPQLLWISCRDLEGWSVHRQVLKASCDGVSRKMLFIQLPFSLGNPVAQRILARDYLERQS